MAIIAESIATNSPGGGSATITLDAPSGVSSGDVLVALVSGAAVSATRISGPAGWVEIEQVVNGTVFIGLFYKVAGSSEPSTYDFTYSQSASARQGGIARYSGVDNTTPADATATTSTGNSDAPVGSAVTTATDDAFVLMGVRTAANVTFTAPAGMSDRFNTARAELYDVEQATAGSSGDKTASISSTTAWATVVGALKPAGGAGAVTVFTSPGVVAVSGPAATVSASTAVQASAGVVTVSGITASVRVGSNVTVSASPGTVSVSGPQAAVVADTTVQASAGVISVSGQQAAILSGGVVVQASPGVIIVSGVAATVDTARYLYDVDVTDEAVYAVAVVDEAIYAVVLADESIYSVALSDASRA